MGRDRLSCAAGARYPLVGLAMAFGFQIACATSPARESESIPARAVRTIDVKLDAVDLAAVREVDLRAAFAELKPDHQLERACFGDDFDPPTATAYFTPAAIGEHASERPRVECEKRFDEHVSCKLSLVPTYFVDDPAKSFEIEAIGAPLSPEQAIEVVRIFEAGEWDEEPGRARWSVLNVNRAGEGFSFQVATADCGGCSVLFWLAPVVRRGEIVGLRANSSVPATACLEGYVDWLESQPKAGTE